MLRTTKAAAARSREWQRRAEGRQQATLGGRRGRRLFERVVLVCQCREFGIEPKPGEFTKALRYRFRAIITGRLAPFMGSKTALADLTGGEVRSFSDRGEIEIVLPAGTSAARVAEVEALCLDYVPVHVVATVRIEGLR